MEVTKDNFEELLPGILDDIEKCSFASIDLEISGLWKHSGPELLENHEEYFNKFIENAADFQCLQFGLTLFTFKPENKRYLCKSFNFYVFPHQISRTNTHTFSSQIASINFLVSHNFDFNKVFYKGVPYLNLQRLDELSKSLEEKRSFKEKNAQKEVSTVEVPEEHKELIDETIEKLSAVLKDGEEEEVRVPGLNAFIRLLIYQTVKERYPNGELLVNTQDGVMVSRKGNIDGNEPKSQIELDNEYIDKCIGFSKIIKALSMSGKLVVGHNMFLDLGHTINNFLSYVPHNYFEFKGLVRGLFPLLLDTKFMSSSEGLRDLIPNSVLGRIASRISEPPFSRPDLDEVEGYSYAGVTDKYHDAGFDSYITGVCFLSMYNYIAGSKDLEGNVLFNPKSPKLARYINRIYMNNSPDLHFYFGGTDVFPDRSHYFFVSFPKEWVSKDIINLFSPYSRITIHWVSNVGAWICLNDKSQAEAVKSSLCGPLSRDSCGAEVTPYSLVGTSSSDDIPPTSSSAKKRSSDHPISPSAKRNRPSQQLNKEDKSDKMNVPDKDEERHSQNGSKSKKKKSSKGSALAGSALASLEEGLASGKSQVGLFSSDNDW